MVTISEQGLRDWERDRVQLHHRGFPDRPPLVDTPSVRSWDPPGDPAALAQASASLVCDPAARSVGVWRAEGNGILFKAHLGRRENGVYVLDLRVGTETRGHRLFFAGTSDMTEMARLAYRGAAACGLPEPEFASTEEIIAELAAEAA